MKIEDLLQQLIDKIEGHNSNIEDRIENIEKKTDKLDTRLDKIDVTLVGQAHDIQHHIYRTEISETRLKHIEDNMEPIKAHVNRLEGSLKFIGIISLVLTIIGSALKLAGVL